MHGIHAIAAKLTPSCLKTTSTNATHALGSISEQQYYSQHKTNPSISSVASTAISTTGETNKGVTGSNRGSLTKVRTSTQPETDGSNRKLKNGVNVNSNKTGLRCVCTEKFNMFVHQTVTGVKIILLASTDTEEYQIGEFQNTVHRLYSDYVLKNPFYNLDMPIRIKLFDDKILSATINYNIK